MASHLQSKLSAFLRRVPKKELLAVLMLVLAIIFFRSERKELRTIIPHLHKANPLWIAAGLAVTAIYIIFQAGIYRQSFRAIGLRFSWMNAILLFLKRNFISVFLPAGSISALAYTPSQIRKAGFSKTQVFQASGLFGFAGLLTVILVGLPVVTVTAFSLQRGQTGYAIAGLGVLVLLLGTLLVLTRSFSRKGKLYHWFTKKFPSATPFIDDLFSTNVHKRPYAGAILFSIGVELCGILHIYIAMLAVGMPPSWMAAAAAYIAAVLMMIVSPFLKGLGAVEISMVYVMHQLGYPLSPVLAMMVLFRVFEFWLPLLVGLAAFAWKGRKIFFRVAPALFTLVLGMVNIASAVIPPIRFRMHVLREYLPVEAMHASNWVVLAIGLGLVLTAAFLLRGARTAWLVAIAFSVISLVGHLTKALDYEEAIIAGITLIILLTTGNQYRSRFRGPLLKKLTTNDTFRQRAHFLLNQYGDSALDYFKVYKDKLYFFSARHQGFIAYRIAGSFAVVLGEPVCAEEYKADILKEFDQQCRRMGLKTAFYRVNEEGIPYFRTLKMKKLMIGQEGIIDVEKFSLEGRDKKSLRNGLNSLQKKGYTVAVHHAPHIPEFIQQLKAVSDEWLQNFTREEMIFAQGMFDERELIRQDVITVEDGEKKILAFMNIIPSYAEDECTYDLIRKTHDAPAAVADALMIQLISYARDHQKMFINLGMVPLTGITQPDNPAEQLLKTLTPAMKRFRQFHGLREFKEKYATFWENKYLVYGHDFDLLQLPAALKKVMQPVY
ncbi:MAG: DUF2156 domain-containing protein [Niastella sp.]|nr:DUF2156 domain-containing protein [Niastella sp.]